SQVKSRKGLVSNQLRPALTDAIAVSGAEARPWVPSETAVQAMGRIRVDNAWRKRSLKRGGSRTRIELGAVEPAGPEIEDDLLELHQVIGRRACSRSSSSPALPSCGTSIDSEAFIPVAESRMPARAASVD